MNVTELYSSKGLLIDTNLLVLLIVGTINPTQISSHKRTTSYSADDYSLLLAFANRFKLLVTTPNILTEASNLLEGYSYRGNYALVTLERFTQGTKEIICESLSTMHGYPKSYLKYGLSDAVIHRVASEKYLILTDDLNFCAYLQGNGLLSINFNNLRIS